MHIAIIRQHFDRNHGGAEQYAVGLARGLLQRGHRISVVCTNADATDIEGMEMVQVSRGKWAGPWRHAAFAARAGKAAAELNSDCVIALARAYPAGVLRLGDPPHAPWLKLRYEDRAGYLRALRNPRHRALLALEERLLTPGAVEYLVANSERVKRQLVHTYGVDPKMIKVIRNPIDPGRFHPRIEMLGDETRAEMAIAKDEMVILFSGMEYRRKGLLQAARTFVALVRGAPHLRDKFRFLVAGRGDASDARALLAEADCADRMIDLPATPRIERLYAAANVLVLPTLYDPSANAVGEALSCGTPVVTTALNGASELIRDGINGMVLGSRDDTEAWAAAITQMLVTERIQRSRRYVAMARPIPAWNNHLDQWEELLDQALVRKLRGRLQRQDEPQETTQIRISSEGQTLYLNNDPKAREVIALLPFSPPEGCYMPARDSIIKSHRGSIVACLGLRGKRPPRDNLFVPAMPARAYLKIAREDSEAGPHEFNACLKCRAAGVATMLPLAAGSDGRRSFILSAEVPGLPVDEFIRHHASGPKTAQRRLRKMVLDAIADTAAAMHDGGMNHRDFYATHIRIALDLRGNVVVTLIDLQRAQSRPAPRLRWIVKDLGQLHFSMDSALVSRTERLRFLRRYQWTLGLSVPRRKLLRLIVRRVAFIERRHQKVLERRKVSDQALDQRALAATDQYLPATLADLDD